MSYPTCGVCGDAVVDLDITGSTLCPTCLIRDNLFDKTDQCSLCRRSWPITDLENDRCLECTIAISSNDTLMVYLIRVIGFQLWELERHGAVNFATIKSGS